MSKLSKGRKGGTRPAAVALDKSAKITFFQAFSRELEKKVDK